MRIGEVCGLKWSDIDLDNQVIHVRRTVQRVKSSNEENKTKVICGSPKSMSSMRDIAIPDHLCTVLRNIQLDGNCYIATLILSCFLVCDLSPHIDNTIIFG